MTQQHSTVNKLTAFHQARNLHFIKYCRQITLFHFSAALHLIKKCHYAFWITGKITHLQTTAENMQCNATTTTTTAPAAAAATATTTILWPLYRTICVSQQPPPPW